MNINAFLTAWLELKADPLAVARRLNLSIEELARNLNLPDLRPLLEAVELLQQAHLRASARDAQLAAADHLRRTLDEAPTPVERRRAATTLVRLCHQMLQPASRQETDKQVAKPAAAEPRPLPPPRTQAPPLPSTTPALPDPPFLHDAPPSPSSRLLNLAGTPTPRAANGRPCSPSSSPRPPSLIPS